jgi:hypothetical protein
MQVYDERGLGVSIRGGWLTPNQNLRFALYTPADYTSVGDGKW